MTTEAHSLLDGELSLYRSIQVRLHLLICKYCRRYVAQLRTTAAVLKKLSQPNLEPSDSEIDDIVQRLKQSQD